MTLIDTNVIIDVLGPDPVWAGWSLGQIESRRATGPVGISDVTYAELAPGMSDSSALDAALRDLGVVLERISVSALFAAGRAFARYRAAGGPRTAILPDLFIGAHAQDAGLPILTRDPRRYRAWFPSVTLIAP